MGLPKPHRVISRFFSVSGRVIRSEDGDQKNHHLVDDELELVPLCKLFPLFHCQCDFCRCVEVKTLVDEQYLDAILLLSSNRGAWRWQRCLFHWLALASSSTCLTNAHGVLLQNGPTL